MGHRRSLLAGSASVLAITAVAAPALAQSTDAGQGNQVQEVVVTGIRASLQKAINIKRKSDDIVDAISAEDIGKLPDRNVADALQRIPGVSTFSAAGGEGGFDENDRVSIRGTPTSLTQVTIDGHSVSTGDWFILDQYQTLGRSVSFALLPSEIVDNVVVDKSQNASLLEGGVAGSIDIQTRSPLSMSKPITMEASFEGAYNSLTGTTKPQVNAMFGWKNADDTFGVIVQGFYEERDVRRYGQETLGYGSLQAPIGCAVASGPYAGSALSEAPALNSSNTAWGCANAVYTPTTAQDPHQVPVNVTANPTGGTPLVYNNPGLAGIQYPTLIGSTLFEQKRTREGGNIALQFRPNDQFEVKLTGFYSDLNASNVNDNYMFWGSQEFTSQVPTSYAIKNNTVVAALFPQTAGINGIVVDNLYRKNADAQTYYVNLDTKFHVNDKLTVSAQVGYTHGVGSTPQAPSLEVDAPTAAGYVPSGNGWAVGFPGFNGGGLQGNTLSPNGLANGWSWNESFRAVDEEFYGKADGDWKVDDGLFKDVQFGARYADHQRTSDGYNRGCQIGGANNDCWGSPATPFSAENPSPYPSGFNGGALGIPGLLPAMAGNPATIESIINGIANIYRGSTAHTIQPINSYWLTNFKVQEQDFGAYVMARVGGDRWRANFGLRIAVTDENAYVNTGIFPGTPAPAGATVITTSAFGNYWINHVQHTYVDPLPSLNFTYDLKPNLLLRFSAAESITRPDYSALGGPVSLTDTNLTGQEGNPNLKPIKSANFDTSLEWYYGKLSNVTLSVFDMELSSYLEYATKTETHIDQALSNVGGVFTPVYRQYTITYPLNTTAEIRGFELAWQTPIAYGFGMLANYAYADGEDSFGNPVIGDSKDTFNLTGYYENHGFSARVAYTYKSKVYIGLNEGSPENQDWLGNLDAAVNWNIGHGITLTAQGLNLTNQLIKYYAASPTQPRAVYENGSQAYFGIRFKY